MGLLSLPKIREKGSRLKFHEVWRRRFLDNAYKDNSQQGVFRDYNFYSDGAGSYSGKIRLLIIILLMVYRRSYLLRLLMSFGRRVGGSVRISFISF